MGMDQNEEDWFKEDITETSTPQCKMGAGLLHGTPTDTAPGQKRKADAMTQGTAIAEMKRDHLIAEARLRDAAQQAAKSKQATEKGTPNKPQKHKVAVLSLLGVLSLSVLNLKNR